MGSKKVLAVVLGTCITAAFVIGGADWAGFFGLSSTRLLGFAALLAIGMLSESMAIRIKYGESAGNTSITFIPLLASVQLFGTEAAIILMGTTGAFGEFVVRRKPPIRGLFNMAQWTTAVGVAGWAFTVLGGVALETQIIGAGPAPEVWSSQLLPFMAFGLVFLAVNHALVSLVVALSQELPFREVWNQILGRSGGSVNDLLVSPIALVVAFLYVQFGLGGILVVLFPLLFIRHSYLQNYQLRESNRDLLKVLVKAIETRDPYTSGHSLRVSHLARRIAEALKQPRQIIERIETGALLHDIGKIDSGYTNILRKPSELTEEERRQIESHVTKGEKFLRNLETVPEEVVRIVRHHHERYDGSGYPDRISGEEIPLGARIIAVCDAVDAMLSDRPYRRALSPVTVVRELIRHSGVQFDPVVVDCLLESDLLTQYSGIMEASRSQGHLGPTRNSLAAKKPKRAANFRRGWRRVGNERV